MKASRLLFTCQERYGVGYIILRRKLSCSAAKKTVLEKSSDNKIKTQKLFPYQVVRFYFSYSIWIGKIFSRIYRRVQKLSEKISSDFFSEVNSRQVG
jgi:hypothetical protein